MTNAEKADSDGTMEHQSEELIGGEENQTTGEMKTVSTLDSLEMPFGMILHATLVHG